MEKDNMFESIIKSASTLPYVKISRDEFLQKALQRYCPKNQIEKAIEYSPAHAGIYSGLIDKIALNHIKLETQKVTALSVAAGIPGGLAMAATIPADLVQYFGHIMRVSQKLAYLYGWQDFSDFDEETEAYLILFIGIMFGVDGATKAVAEVTKIAAPAVARNVAKLPLAKGVLYPVIKKMLAQIGIRLNKSLFARSVAKLVPILGGAVSGGLTWATFMPMSIKLQKELKTFIQASPDFFAPASDDVIIDVDFTEAVEQDDSTGQDEE